jgi:hypothetical protein
VERELRLALALDRRVAIDADDWPEIIYAGLGFETVGTQVQFTLRSGRT